MASKSQEDYVHGTEPRGEEPQGEESQREESQGEEPQNEEPGKKRRSGNLIKKERHYELRKKPQRKAKYRVHKELKPKKLGSKRERNLKPNRQPKTRVLGNPPKSKL